LHLLGPGFGDGFGSLSRIALRIGTQPLASFAVGAMLGGKSVKHGKDGATDRRDRLGR
jgi:hypothetical protein